jgi:hypothetical protein
MSPLLAVHRPKTRNATVTDLSQLQTNKTALDRTRIVTTPLPALKAGEALVRIDRLAVTANNITYAAFGDVPHLRYWSFFPTAEEGWDTCPRGALQTS